MLGLLAQRCVLRELVLRRDRLPARAALQADIITAKEKLAHIAQVSVETGNIPSLVQRIALLAPQANKVAFLAKVVLLVTLGFITKLVHRLVHLPVVGRIRRRCTTVAKIFMGFIINLIS